MTLPPQAITLNQAVILNNQFLFVLSTAVHFMIFTAPHAPVRVYAKSPFCIMNQCSQTTTSTVNLALSLLEYDFPGPLHKHALSHDITGYKR